MNGIQWLAKPLSWTAYLLLATGIGGCAGKEKWQAMPVGPDITAPTVSATTPSLAAVVATSANVKVLFSEPMDGATITATSFTLSQGTTPVLSTVTYEGNVATLTPIAKLTADTLFTATIHTGAKDKAGNALAADRSWTFTTRITVAGHRNAAPSNDEV